MVYFQKPLSVAVLALTWAMGTIAFAQTKIIAHVTVNLFEKNINKMVARTVHLREGHDMHLTAKLFCAKVGAKHETCASRIEKGLQSNFQKRIQEELIFDLQITNPEGIQRQFFYFKSDTVSDAIVSFFTAYPEFPRDAASTNTLVQAVNTQLRIYEEAQQKAKHSAKKADHEEPKEQKDEMALVDQSMFSYLVIGDHCKAFADVHACKMELLYGPGQVPTDASPVIEETSKMRAEELSMLHNGHACMAEESKVSLDEELENDISFAQIITYTAMMCAAWFTMTVTRKTTRRAKTVDTTNLVVDTIKSVDVCALSEVSNSQTKPRTERLVTKKMDGKRNEMDGKENLVNHNFSSATKKVRKITRTPLRARQVHRSPVMPRI